MDKLKLALREIEEEIKIEESKLLDENITDNHKYYLKGRISSMYYCLSVIKHKIGIR